MTSDPLLPDRPALDAEALRAALVRDDTPWTDLVVLETTGSTNSDAAALARAGAPSGLVVTTEHQTAGRGRLDRSFTTPARSCVVVSVVLRPEHVPPQAWVWLPLLTGLAVRDTVAAAGVEAGVKWPNDVLISGRKISGILLERVESPAGPAAVLGIGLNVDLTTEELPVPTATSLLLEGAHTVDRATVLQILLEKIARHYEPWTATGGDPRAGLQSAYRAACVTLGQEVRVELPDGSDLLGEATDIDVDGRLVVAGQHLSAGDVTHVRQVL